MIYIIIGQDASGNEWVQAETFDNSLDAATRCQELNNIYAEVDSHYRVETVERETGKTPTRSYADKLVKDRLNAEFGRNKMDHEEGYPDTDSISEHRTKDFTIDELFPQGTHAIAYTLTCSECACEVKNVMNPYLIKHTDWHNKLLP